MQKNLQNNIIKRGRPRNMNNPNELMQLWEQYKSKIDSSPDTIEQATAKGEIVELRVKKPYLKQGFTAFVFKLKGYSIKDYLDNKYDNFSDVVTCIRNEWEDDQISGTLTGRYKAPNLVARLNGITENVKQEQNININKMPEWLKSPIENITE
jgi:hypothetical protein